LGVLGVCREPNSQPISGPDAALAEALAARAVMALENARLYKDLEQADRQKDEFLSMLAHELRNPLAPIRNAIDVLNLGGVDAADLSFARDIIDRQTNHLVRLVDDLLDISRITQGKIHLELECVDVASIVTASLESSRPMIDAGEHQLHVSVPSEPLWLNCDRVRMAQVLSNLLNNAAKYTPRGGTISLDARRLGADVVFTVRDDGIGITPDMISKVFKLFVQVDRSLDRSQGGLGIGLTLVERLVEMHHGSVQVASDGPGRGSEFTVRLPAAEIAPDAAAEPALERAPANDSRLRVLVVDDNVDAARVTSLLLRRKNHDVRTAHDGQFALQVAQSFSPHVVILDIGLPEVDGFEVARRLRELDETRESLLVALTGYGRDGDRKKSVEVGFDFHLVKPVDAETLLQIVSQGDKAHNMIG
jgi:signal transduction histidine kinase/ActR/RegA family two-component response regulator